MSSTRRTTPTMRAWAIDAYGSPNRMRLMELPVPEPKSGDVLIHMQGAEVGDWDALICEGGWDMGRPFPLVIGLAGAGTVAAHGRDVTGFTQGDPVYAYSYPLYDNGAWAEFMLVPATYVAAAPTTMDLTRAGAVPIVGLTAHETLTSILKLQPQETVLITAAAGGVGHLAVQIATDIGAHVVATASGRNHDFVRDIGAETVIDYTEGDFIPTLRSRYPKGVDKALNGVSGETANQVIWALRDGGQMVDLTGSASAKRPNVQIDTDYVVRADGKRLAIVRQLIDEKRLKVKIQEIFPFERAPDALERVLARHVRGKVAIQVAR